MVLGRSKNPLKAKNLQKKVKEKINISEKSDTTKNIRSIFKLFF